MPDKKIKWTENQQTAIDTINCDVMVAASAGTGKTAVLSKRCSQIASSDSSFTANVDQMLVLTFTEAAADEMRSRIADQLKEAFLTACDKNTKQKLKHQLLSLDSADICTIHSFCKTIITEHFYLLGIDPTFAVIDADEQALIKSEILDELIESAWHDPTLAENLDNLLYRRNPDTLKGFLNNIIRINDFLESIPDKNNWFQKANQLTTAANSLPVQLIDQQTEHIQNTLINSQKKIIHSMLLDNELANAHWQEGLNDLLNIFHDLADSTAMSFDLFKTKFDNFQKPRFKAKLKDFDDEIKDIILTPAKEALKDLENLKQLATLDPEYSALIGQAANIQTKTLIELVKHFALLYYEHKNKLNCLDFSDLEYFALKLLYKDDQLTETAIALQQKYKYIFVDEYQDINEVQEKILKALADQNNLFGVGDVKQSIYAFRQAQPKIFLEKIKSAKPQKLSPDQSFRVDLTDNFRSRPEILNFVNHTFARIMQKDIADLNYDTSAHLNSGFEYEPANPPFVELHILDESEQTENNAEKDIAKLTDSEKILRSATKDQRQALLIAQRIKKMVEQEKPNIFDKDTKNYRPVQYRDITILMRSLSKRAASYIEIFRLLDIPVSTSASTGYFDTTEITDCISLLKLLGNPQQDIELASILRSPMFNFTETELAKTRFHTKPQDNKPISFYTCVENYIKTGSDKKLQIKLSSFLEDIQTWRTLARKGSLTDLIWHILRQTNYLSFVQALPNGQQKRANLLKLHARAIQFEGFTSSSKVISLTRFIDFIEKLLEQGHDWSTPQPSTESSNGIQIMSVHKSKGLEFPIVFLAQTATKFNLTDTTNDCLIDSDTTLGLNIINAQQKTKHSTLAHQIIKQKHLNTALAEEMRILYVAATRARERLIIVGAERSKNIRSILISSAAILPEKPACFQLAKCRNQLHWLFYALSDSKQLHKIFETNFEHKARQVDLFTAHLYSTAQLEQFCKDINELKSTSISKDNKPDNVLLNKILKDLNFQYPFTPAAKLKAKTSVSLVSSQQPPKTNPSDEFAQPDYSQTFQKQTHKTASATQIGSATHLVLQNIDLTKPADKNNIQQTIDNLLSKDLLAKYLTKQINIDSIKTFFGSELGKLCFEPNNKILREWPFTYSLDSQILDSNCEHETVILQGIIDMIIQTPDGLVVIDFKTDNITADQVSQRAEKYRTQINLYATAAAEILSQPILSKNLYFLTPSKLFKID